MSCESRHRDIVAALLTLARLHGTVNVDDIMRVGVGIRHRTRGGPKDNGGALDWLHNDVKTELGIEGHAGTTSPSWIHTMITSLQAAMVKGNRHAFLTLQFLVGGFHAVTKVLEPIDREWLLSITRLGVTIPREWRERVPIIRRAIAHNLYVLEDAPEWTDIFSALIGIDDVPQNVVQAVTPIQVLRFLCGIPFSSVTDLRPVLRAVLEGTSVVHTVASYLDTMPHGSIVNLRRALIGCAAHASGRLLAQVGSDIIIRYIAEQIHRESGLTLDRADFYDPSPTVISKIAHHIGTIKTYSTARVLAPLLHSWHTHGRYVAVTGIIEGLKQIADEVFRRFPVELVTVALLVTDVVHPPHGDSLFARIADIDEFGNDGELLAAAVYAAACQQMSHVPRVDGLADRLRATWISRRYKTTPSPFPLLTIGREREILLPALTAARGTPDNWVSMILDGIDAMDMLAAVGGDPQALLEVIREAITVGSDLIDPLIIIRLAASSSGQAILDQLPNVPPLQVELRGIVYNDRIAPHLVSPWWATAPPALQHWWQQMMTQIATSGSSDIFACLPPFYPIIAPRIALVCPSMSTVQRAIANRRWSELPEYERRACLESAFERPCTLGDIADVIVSAGSVTALHDMQTVLQLVPYLSEDEKAMLQELIDSALTEVS